MRQPAGSSLPAIMLGRALPLLVLLSVLCGPVWGQTGSSSGGRPPGSSQYDPNDVVPATPPTDLNPAPTDDAAVAALVEEFRKALASRDPVRIKAVWAKVAADFDAQFYIKKNDPALWLQFQQRRAIDTDNLEQRKAEAAGEIKRLSEVEEQYKRGYRGAPEPVEPMPDPSDADYLAKVARRTRQVEELQQRQPNIKTEVHSAGAAQGQPQSDGQGGQTALTPKDPGAANVTNRPLPGAHAGGSTPEAAALAEEYRQAVASQDPVRIKAAWSKLNQSYDAVQLLRQRDPALATHFARRSVIEGDNLVQRHAEAGGEIKPFSEVEETLKRGYRGAPEPAGPPPDPSDPDYMAKLVKWMRQKEEFRPMQPGLETKNLPGGAAPSNTPGSSPGGKGGAPQAGEVPSRVPPESGPLGESPARFREARRQDGFPRPGEPDRPGSGGASGEHLMTVLTIIDTTDQILRCKDENLTAEQCATRMLTNAAIGAAINVAAVLTGTVPVVMAVGLTMATIRGVGEAAQLVEEVGNLIAARREEERIKGERRHQQDLNKPFLDQMTAEERTKIITRLGSVADALTGVCERLKGMAGPASAKGREAQAVLATLPSAGEIAGAKNAAASCVQASESHARLELLRDRVQGYAAQVTAAFQKLEGQAQACRTAEDAALLQQGWQACVGLSKGIGQLTGEARGLATVIPLLRSQAATAKATIARAQAAKDRIVSIADQATANAGRFENDYATAVGLANDLQARAEASLTDIGNLRASFRIQRQEEALFLALKDTVVEYQGKTCPADAYRQQFTDGMTQAANARLDAENRIEGLGDGSADLALCDGIASESAAAQMDDAEREVASQLVVSSGIPGKASQCLNQAQAAAQPGASAGTAQSGSGGFSSRGGENVAVQRSEQNAGAGQGPATEGGFSSRGGENAAAQGSSVGSAPSNAGVALQSPADRGYGPAPGLAPPFPSGPSPQDTVAAAEARQRRNQQMADMLRDFSNAMVEIQRSREGGGSTPPSTLQRRSPPAGGGSSAGTPSSPQVPSRPSAGQSPATSQGSGSSTQSGARSPSTGATQPTKGGGTAGGGNCLYRVCPMCAQTVDLLTIAVDPKCTACKQEKKAQIDACAAGGTSGQASAGTGSAPSAAGSGNWYYDPRGLPNPKEWCAQQKYQTSIRQYEYTIGKCADQALNPERRTIYGPDTFDGCKAWLINKKYW
jgi:hypothetical protein